MVERDRLATRQSRRPHPRFRQPEATSPSPRYRNAAAMITTSGRSCAKRALTVATPWSSSRSPRSSPPDRRSCLGTPKDLGGAGRPATRSCPTPTRQPAHQARAMSISGDVHPGLRTTKPIESTFATVRGRGAGRGVQVHPSRAGPMASGQRAPPGRTRPRRRRSSTASSSNDPTNAANRQPPESSSSTGLRCSRSR